MSNSKTPTPTPSPEALAILERLPPTAAETLDRNAA
jgi:hypothetical protein